MTRSIRSRYSFTPQQKFESGDFKIEDITNIIHTSTCPEEDWIAQTTQKIGDWRDMSRSVYLRWALTINAMEVSQKYYEELEPNRALQTQTIRVENGIPKRVTLVNWDGREASEKYIASQEPISAYGFADMYGVIEDITFEAYEIYLQFNPVTLLKGSDYKDLRNLYAKKMNIQKHGKLQSHKELTNGVAEKLTMAFRK
ncbi:hypothetical protein SAMN06273572_105175 [Monaibacterium marinum]|uniref:Uncharacterized protein n=1 Tax=Pontivivens marinum TaxID=1690039 RepID=A0A2C9CTC5_9RHOB|nr:hypothetical protein [Monaibacterium marinum]SOH94751.1 hypothetical protein SAMN06273572_105175 [Monaibacterium marinum]